MPPPGDIEQLSFVARWSDVAGAASYRLDVARSNIFTDGITPSAWINEIHYDNSGTDTGEGVEIAGTAGFDLDGYSLVGYNGYNGEVYRTVSLSGSIDDEGDDFGAAWFAYPENGIQNGAPDGLALIDNSGTVVQFLSYEGVFTAAEGPAAGMTSTDIGVEESAATPAGYSLQLRGSGGSYTDFTWHAPSSGSPGSLNSGQTAHGVGNGTYVDGYRNKLITNGQPCTVTGLEAGLTYWFRVRAYHPNDTSDDSNVVGPITTVPEPAALAALAIAIVAVIRARMTRTQCD
jgi:hypothetical protein